MADIAFPTLSREAVAQLEWKSISPAEVFESPIDGSVQTGDTQGPRWALVADLRPMAEADIAEFQAFLAKLRGKTNRALVRYFAREVPRGTINLSGVTVNGALSVGATQLDLSGCGSATTLLTGDFIGIGGQLLMVVDGPHTASGGGAMTSVKFEHPLRAIASHGAPVTTDKPTCRMILAGQSNGWPTGVAVISKMALQFEEALA